jgi:hypothetical protein
MKKKFTWKKEYSAWIFSFRDGRHSPLLTLPAAYNESIIAVFKVYPKQHGSTN